MTNPLRCPICNSSNINKENETVTINYKWSKSSYLSWFYKCRDCQCEFVDHELSVINKNNVIAAKQDMLDVYNEKENTNITLIDLRSMSNGKYEQLESRINRTCV